MSFIAFADLLAALPDTSEFINPWKLGAIVILFAIWAFFSQWTDKDAIAVNTYQAIWNLITVGTGLATVIAVLFIPNFWIGFSLFFVAVFAVIISYVLHRNGLVREEDKVLTAAHIAGLMSGDGKKKDQKEVKERVRIIGADGKPCRLPEDDEEARNQFGLTQDLLFDVVWNRAERVEMLPVKEIARVAYSIDGEAGARPDMMRADADAVLTYMKTVAGLDLEERRKPQSGKIKLKMGEETLDVEVRTDGSTAGEKLVLRIIGAEATYKITDIGLTEKQLGHVREIMENGKGLVLLSGPKGSGLTTTTYAFTRSHDAFLHNIQMLEYRRELPIDNVTQMQYTPSENRTFSEDLQKVFRTDPDIVIVPEIHEQASSVIATDAAIRKQLVYVGLPASDVVSATRKWLELVGDNNRVADALVAVTNQRMVRRLCPTCKQPYKPDPAQLRKLNFPADTVLYRQPEPEYDKKGEPIICQHCHGTGYVGRVAVYELMLVNDVMKEVLKTAKSSREIQAAAAKQGSVGLQKQAIQKVLDGTTSIQEITRVLRGKQSSGASQRAS